MKINENLDGETMIRVCKGALNDAISLVDSDDLDSDVVDEVIGTLKKRVSLLEKYLRAKATGAPSSLSENQKVTLTLGQLKRLVKESVGSGLGDKDVEQVGEVLGDLFRTAAGEGDYSHITRLQCAEKLNKIIQLIDQALIKFMNDSFDPRISAAYHAVDALIEELRA